MNRIIDITDLEKRVQQLVHTHLSFQRLNKDLERSLGLSLVQHHLLYALKDLPASSPQRLAQSIGTHPSTLTQSMKRLKRKQLLFIEEDPRDSRKKIIGLTRKGESALKRFKRELKDFLTQEKPQWRALFSQQVADLPDPLGP